jgi:hypothetical protein
VLSKVTSTSDVADPERATSVARHNRSTNGADSRVGNAAVARN